MSQDSLGADRGGRHPGSLAVAPEELGHGALFHKWYVLKHRPCGERPRLVSPSLVVCTIACRRSTGSHHPVPIDLEASRLQLSGKLLFPATDVVKVDVNNVVDVGRRLFAGERAG